MADILQTSLSGLLAFQRALLTTSHNITNANTEGYSRQRVEFGTRDPERLGPGFVGTGVKTQSVRRIFDGFLAQQVRLTTASLGRLGALTTLATRMDNLLADPEAGVAPSLQAFFSALQEVADDPASLPARELLLGAAGGLADRFETLDGRLAQLNGEVNSRIDTAITEINGFTESLAELNREIVVARGATGSPPNDLLDRRDLLLEQLSEQIGITLAEQDDGAMNVFTGSGQSLVVGSTAAKLQGVANGFDLERLEVVLAGTGGSAIISDLLSGGELGGVLDFRRQVLDPARNALGRVATGVAGAMNEQHRQGMDLQGLLGGDFFTIAPPQTLPNSANAGTGSVSALVTDVTQLTTDDYVLSFDGASYTLTRAATGQTVPMSGTGTAVDPFLAEGLSLEVAAGAVAGDRFMIRPTRIAAGKLGVLVTDPRSVAAALPIRTSATPGNIGDATISPGEVLDVTDPGLLNPVSITFLTANTYSINGAGAFAYTAGAPIDINGARVVISGSPQPGDEFTIQSNAGGVGDNRNALSLAAIQARAILDGATGTLDDGYRGMVAEVGTATRQAEVNRDAASVLALQARQDLDAVVGVNLDEEAANLLRYQQAYQAAAQSVAVVDTLFQSLLSAIGR